MIDERDVPESATIVGSYDVQCPACPTVVPVPVSCGVVNNENAWLGEARLVCDPDMSDLWAHMWSHS